MGFVLGHRRVARRGRADGGGWPWGSQPQGHPPTSQCNSHREAGMPNTIQCYLKILVKQDLHGGYNIHGHLISENKRKYY